MIPGGSCDGAGSAAAAASTSESSKGGGRAQGTSSAAAAAAMKKGPWTAAEDAILMEYVRKHGEGNWNAVQKNSGLSRCGKSCRLRWANHLRPNLKKGPFSPDEERLILELHAKFGNKWARMAAQLPGRTDNEIKNYWNTRIKRRQRAGLPLYPPDIQHHQPSALHHRPSTTGIAPSTTSDHKPLYSTSIGGTPLSLFDPINFAAPGPGAAATTSNAFLGLGQHLPFLAPSSQQRGAKRFREDDAGGFSLPFSSHTHPVAPPPLSQNPFFPFSSLGAFDLSPPPPQPQQHQQPLLQHGFPVKTELPSSQFFYEPSRAVTAGVVGLPLRRSNCELLDALLRDTHPVGGGGGNDGDGSDEPAHEPEDWLPPDQSTSASVKWTDGEDVDGRVGELSRGLFLGAGAGSKWDDSDHRTNADQTRRQGGGGSVEDDLSALLIDLIPAVASAAAAPREWYNSDSGEVSNGQQSSGVTDENAGLQQHLVSTSLTTLAAAGEEVDHSWSIGSCHWKDMPSTC